MARRQRPVARRLVEGRCTGKKRDQTASAKRRRQTVVAGDVSGLCPAGRARNLMARDNWRRLARKSDKTLTVGRFSPTNPDNQFGQAPYQPSVLVRKRRPVSGATGRAARCASSFALARTELAKRRAPVPAAVARLCPMRPPAAMIASQLRKRLATPCAATGHGGVFVRLRACPSRHRLCDHRPSGRGMILSPTSTNPLDIFIAA